MYASDVTCPKRYENERALDSRVRSSVCVKVVEDNRIKLLVCRFARNILNCTSIEKLGNGGSKYLLHVYISRLCTQRYLYIARKYSSASGKFQPYEYTLIS